MRWTVGLTALSWPQAGLRGGGAPKKGRVDWIVQGSGIHEEKREKNNRKHRRCSVFSQLLNLFFMKKVTCFALVWRIIVLYAL